MIITEIKEFNKTKCELTTDEEVSLVLYKGDLRRYGLKEGGEITDKQVFLLMEEMLPKRARERCLKLLQSRDYTEGEIRKKLISDGYPKEVIDKSVDFLKGYDYLNDSRYIRLYYQSKSCRKSKKQIILDLQQKGIGKELIVTVLAEIVPEEENGGDLYCIRKLLLKKKYEDTETTFEEKEKIKMYLFRKGFELKDINLCMKNFTCKEI